MFGFGRASKEKAVIHMFALQLESLGISSSQAVRNATKLVDEVLADLRPRGIDPFKSTQGSEHVDNPAFVAPRLAAGLTLEDIKTHWNRPLLVIFCEVKMRELINFIAVDSSRQQGKDITAAGQQYKMTFVRYGNPAHWDPSEKFNAGLTEADADLFPEFAARVDRWRSKISDEEVNALIVKYGTLNAALRQKISVGAV